MVKDDENLVKKKSGSFLNSVAHWSKYHERGPEKRERKW